MPIFKTRENRIFFFCCIAVIALFTLPASAIDTLAAVLLLISCISLVILFMISMYRRDQKISELSNYLAALIDNRHQEMPQDNVEGELSVLKSEIYKMTITLREQAEQLSKDKFYLARSLSDISHQLKTPLTSMLLIISLMKKDNLDADKRRRLVWELDSLVSRLDWLAASLLKISKLDAGAVVFRTDKQIIRQVVERAVRLFDIPMELRQQHLEISGDTETSFAGDMEWTAEAIGNIIKNCIEYTPERGTIKVHYDENPLFSRIIIEDTGPGIDKEDLPHIFERFYKGKNAGEASVGIGLALSKMIVEKQNGSVEAESTVGSGAKFIIKFYKGII